MDQSEVRIHDGHDIMINTTHIDLIKKSDKQRVEILFTQLSDKLC